MNCLSYLKFFLNCLSQLKNCLSELKNGLSQLKNCGPHLKFFLGVFYCVVYGIFCFYCFYDWFFISFFENVVYNIESVDEVKTEVTTDKTTETKVKKKKVRSWFKEPRIKLKKLPKVKNFTFPGASFTFEYYLALINSNFQLLTSVKEIQPHLSVIESTKKKKYKVKSETHAEVLERFSAPIKRGKDRRASGDRVAKAMEAAIQHGIINYKEFCVPFTNILDKSNIFAFDKWLYGDYYVLVRLDNFLQPKSEKDFSDFVLICQFMEKYNFKYNLTRDELDYLLAFKKHYNTHNVEWNFVEGLLCLESYKNHLELLEHNGVLGNISNLKKEENITRIKNLINIENIKNIENIDKIINVENKENIPVLNVKKRIPLLLMFDLDLRLAYAKHSVTMIDSYYGALRVFTYPDDKFNTFLRIKKRFDDFVLIVNIIEGFALLEHFKPTLTASSLGYCGMFGVQNSDGLLHEYIHVIVDKRFHRLPISIIYDHFKYDPTFRKAYNNLVKRKSIQYLNLWLMDVLHNFFYANGSCKDYLRALLVQTEYPHSLIMLNNIKNSAPDFTFDQILDVYKLHCKYNKIGYMEWGHYFTGRKYSVEQLIKFYKLLQTSAGKNKEAELLSYLRKHDKLFGTYNNVNEIQFHKKVQKRGLK